MAWIREILPEDATGLLKAEYDKAIRRAGRVWHIVRIMGLNPRVMKSSMQLYLDLFYGPGPLTRVQRELLATVVSAELDCFY